MSSRLKTYPRETSLFELHARDATQVALRITDVAGAVGLLTDAYKDVVTLDALSVLSLEIHGRLDALSHLLINLIADDRAPILEAAAHCTCTPKRFGPAHLHFKACPCYAPARQPTEEVAKGLISGDDEGEKVEARATANDLGAPAVDSSEPAHSEKRPRAHTKCRCGHRFDQHNDTSSACAAHDEGGTWDGCVAFERKRTRATKSEAPGDESGNPGQDEAPASSSGPSTPEAPGASTDADAIDSFDFGGW